MGTSLQSIINNKTLSLSQVMNLLSLESDTQTVIKLTRKWCMKSSSECTHRICMEFLYMNGLYTDLQIMINKNKDSQNPLNREWSKYYKIMIDRRFNLISPQKTLDIMKQMQSDQPELKCLIGFIKISAYYSLGKFHEIGNFLYELDTLLPNVKDRSLVSYFNIRTYQSLFIYHWTRNEVVIARKYAYQILNKIIDLRVKVSMHTNIGLSYTFESYTQAMYHLNEALKISLNQDFNQHVYMIKNNNIPFISAHFKQVDSISSEDKAEQAHIEIARGNYDTANELLAGSSETEPFNLYYLGCARQDKGLLRKSYHIFIKEQADYFFARLPLNALRKWHH